MTDRPGVYFWIPDCAHDGAAGHYMKIGRSKDLMKRAAGVQTGCPYRLLQLWALWVDDIEAAELESHLHKQFDRFHMHHEWFEVPTLYWWTTQKIIPIIFDGAVFEKLIDNGPLRIDYLPKGLSKSAALSIAESIADEMIGNTDG